MIYSTMILCIKALYNAQHKLRGAFQYAGCNFTECHLAVMVNVEEKLIIK